MVAELVGVTLGSKGRNVVLQNKYGPPRSSMTVRLSSNSLAPTNPPSMRNDKRQERVKIVEDITNGITSGIQSSSPVSLYTVDEPFGDLISPAATEVESVNEESEYEDDKADEEDKNE